MKKIVLIVLSNLICLSIHKCFAQQSVYYDALFIRNKCFDPVQKIFKNPADLHTVLIKYFPANQALTDNVIKANPFFTDFVGVGGIQTVDASSYVNSALKSVGGLDITNIADGFAKFIVQRTKTELNVAFFEKFGDLMKDPHYKDALILFPQTCATLNTIGDQIYYYEAYINTLRESFEKDLNNMLGNLPKIIENDRYTTFFNAHRELKSICLGSLFIGKGLLNKEQPGKILAEFNPNILDGFTNKDIKASFQTLQLFSESFRSNGSTNYWIDGTALDALVNDPATLQIYFGLIYQKAGLMDINFNAGSFKSLLAANLLPAAKIVNANNFLHDLINQTNHLSLKIQNISGKENDKLSFSELYEFYNSALDFFEYAENIKQLPGLSSISLGTDFQNYINMGRTAGNIAIDINRRNYNSAIINSLQLYSFGFNGNDSTNKFKAFLLKYGSFMATVSQAENSDDVKKAIDAAALPSGSSRIKRVSVFNVSLNAYCGLFAAMERQNIMKEGTGSLINSFGITAPVGLACSWSTKKRHWSHSVFLSVIDIGAITSFRFLNDTLKTLPKIELKDIISPGVFYSIGIPKSPLSINMGYQIAPFLKDVSVSNNTTVASYQRISVSILVDIPLLNFYTKPR